MAAARRSAGLGPTPEVRNEATGNAESVRGRRPDAFGMSRWSGGCGQRIGEVRDLTPGCDQPGLNGYRRRGNRSGKLVVV